VCLSLQNLGFFVSGVAVGLCMEKMVVEEIGDEEGHMSSSYLSVCVCNDYATRLHLKGQLQKCWIIPCGMF